MGRLIDEFEVYYWAKNVDVVGIDEAGRGPMAGPCVVCGVVFPNGYYNDQINDSKQLSRKKRDALVSIIKENAVWYHTEVVTPQMIDESNIYKETQNAMHRIAALAPCNDVLTDAMPLPFQEKHVVSIIKGDQRSISIAAASILAKSYRDEIMEAYDIEYPQYGFSQHKGYGTKAHKEAILEFGRCPVHRKTFKFKDEDQMTLDI